LKKKNVHKEWFAYSNGMLKYHLVCPIKAQRLHSLQILISTSQIKTVIHDSFLPACLLFTLNKRKKYTNYTHSYWHSKCKNF